MRVSVNGELIDLEGSMSIADFLGLQGIGVSAVAVEHNGRLTKREEWASTMLEEDDLLEVVHILGGG